MRGVGGEIERARGEKKPSMGVDNKRTFVSFLLKEMKHGVGEKRQSREVQETLLTLLSASSKGVMTQPREILKIESVGNSSLRI